MAAKIFINYRREDDPGAVHALFGQLERAFPPEQVFVDIDSIEPGLDFTRILDEQVAKCEVVLVVIGERWLNSRDQAGARRLDNPQDFVRIEIESALSLYKRVIPVLVGGAQMPKADELPETIRPLATRHAVRLTYVRFRADVEGLIKSVRQVLEEADERARQAAAAEAERQRPLREAQKEALRLEILEEERQRAKEELEEQRQRAKERSEAERRAEEERRRKAETTGTVKYFNVERGYGFIKPDSGVRDVFVHISHVERSGLKTLNEGQRISFDIEIDRKGKGPKAVNLVLLSERSPD